MGVSIHPEAVRRGDPRMPIKVEISTGGYADLKMGRKDNVD